MKISTTMTDMEIFASDFKSKMQKLHQHIGADSSDIKTYIHVSACGVVGQVTAEVHHMSYKMDALKAELDAQVDMLSGKLDKQTRLLTSVLCLVQILVMALMVYCLETVQPRAWVMVKQGFIEHFIDLIDYLGEFLPEAPKTQKTPTDRGDLRILADGLIYANKWLMNLLIDKE